MNPLALFGISTLMSLVSSALIASLYVWPSLATMHRNQALVWLVTPHMFFRFVGLSLLVPGVTSPSLPEVFAVPAAYGDFVAGVLAILATIALSQRAPLAIAAVWAFNIWGMGDFLFAFFQGPLVHLQPGDLGAAFFIPTALVPPLLVTHILIFRLLARSTR